MARDVVVGLLRAVNVGGRTLTSALLRQTAERLGYGDVTTYVSSGNVVLTTTDPAARVADALSAALTAETGFAVPVITRTGRQWHRIVDALPFPDEARDDPSRLVVVTWDGPVSDSALAFEPARYGSEQVQWRDRELYAYYPQGQGRSKLTLPVLEKAAGRRGSARNWRTVLALDALVRERE